jgi:hypothetical protein
MIVRAASQVFADASAMLVVSELRLLYPEITEPKVWARFTRAIEALYSGDEPCTDGELALAAEMLAKFAAVLCLVRADAKAAGTNRDVVAAP